MKTITTFAIALMLVVPAVTFAGGGFDDYTMTPDGRVISPGAPSAYTGSSTPVGMVTGTNNNNNNLGTDQMAAAGATSLPLRTSTKVALWVLGIAVASLLVWGSYKAWKQNQIMR